MMGSFGISKEILFGSHMVIICYDPASEIFIFQGFVKIRPNVGHTRIKEYQSLANN